ncbi:hypothetical protein HIM_08752 [Hirsutella minnesotensis 3608]|uniref:Acyl-CoA thioesterase II n=1 Tax=Hirsutella minnesotensis 3608 TaxID=1043627 RepID=A0A0F7ZY60_9HYPO|nr:hypothetical protein HIM_08752 [Hirsutella minnesotensis 3608]
MAASLASQVAVKETGPDEYLSMELPIAMGNKMPIAYGGVILGVAVSAALATVPAKHKLYSVVGHFLGPTSLKQRLQCKVTRTRDTRSFTTRRVTVGQVQPGGAIRLVVELIADFHFEASNALFAADERYFIRRWPPESMSAQNLGGMVTTIPTKQDSLSITARSSAEWYRAREALGDDRDQIASLLFLMDAGLSFLPLTHSHRFLDDVGACSTLDFALRILKPDLDLEQWHIRERTTSAAGHGRTFSEGRLWDEQGHMVASMTQQSIMRPKEELRGKL